MTDDSTFHFNFIGIGKRKGCKEGWNKIFFGYNKLI